MTTHPYFIVRFRVDPKDEEAFNQWYNHEYLDTLKPIAPLFTKCYRLVGDEEGDRVYMTIYEIKDEASIEEAVAAFDRPGREQYGRQWQVWEKKGIKDMDDHIFHTVYSW